MQSQNNEFFLVFVVETVQFWSPPKARKTFENTFRNISVNYDICWKNYLAYCQWHISDNFPRFSKVHLELFGFQTSWNANYIWFNSERNYTRIYTGNVYYMVYFCEVFCFLQPQFGSSNFESLLLFSNLVLSMGNGHTIYKIFDCFSQSSPR